MNVPIGELFLAAATTAAPAVESAPAAGAEIKQILIGGLATSIWMAVFVILGLRHRAGSTTLLDRADAAVRKRTGLPGWSVIPYGVAVVALAIAGVGFVWDVALHLNSGRDAGPFANPSHYMLIVGVVLFVTAGWLAIVMPKAEGDENPIGDSGVKLGHRWYAPAGGLAMLACGTMAMTGFVADDVWHRLFGQDVTLWGPTHLMMITGGLLVLFSSFVLMREGMRSVRPPRTRAERRADAANGENQKGPVALISTALLLGGALTGFTIAYQQEFSYGFPQFRLLFHPVLIAFSAAVVLTAARTLYGRGGALIAMAGSIFLSGLLSFVVATGFGELTLHFPLYAVEALLVELAAIATLRRGRYLFAAVSGVLIGTVGLLAEFGWSMLWMPIEWPAHILPEAAALAVIVGICGAVVGTFFGTTLTADRESPLLGRRAALAPIAALAVFAAVAVTLLPTTSPEGLTAKVSLTEATAAPARSVNATIRFSDAAIAENADWVQGFAWQGDDGMAQVDALERVAPGVWRTTEPLPVHGTWKSAMRVHRGSTMTSLPLYMPADSALNLPVTPAPTEFTRQMVGDREMMQRERRTDVPGWLFSLGSILVALMTFSLVLLLGWALLRVARFASPGSAGVAQPARDAVDRQQAEPTDQFVLGT